MSNKVVQSGQSGFYNKSHTMLVTDLTQIESCSTTLCNLNRSPSRLPVVMSVYQAPGTKQAPQPRHLAVLLYHEHTNKPTYKREGDLLCNVSDFTPQKSSENALF